MPHVVLATSNGREFTSGLAEFEVAASSFRQLVLEMEGRFPGLGAQI